MAVYRTASDWTASGRDVADYRDDGQRHGARRGLGAALNGLAAVVSVALVLGLATWGYRLAVRDVTGVPVVRALEGPMRVAPAAPGGVVAAHQGLAVNAVVAEGAAGGPAERLVLAPRPVDLTEEDAPGLAALLPAPVSSRAEGLVALALPPLDDLPPAVLPPAATASQEDAIAAALAEALGEDPAIVAVALAGQMTPVSGNLDAATPRLRVAPTMPRGAFATPVRPRPRPGTIAAPAVVRIDADPAGLIPAAAGAAAAAPAREVAPDTLGAGARLVQLGAFDTPEAARAEWDRVVARFADLMADKGRVVQEAHSGGRGFWRLRAEGFASEAEARRFCAALLAEQTSCIPVTLR